jgi:hypothetical protein
MVERRVPGAVHLSQMADPAFRRGTALQSATDLGVTVNADTASTPVVEAGKIGMYKAVAKIGDGGMGERALTLTVPQPAYC